MTAPRVVVHVPHASVVVPPDVAAAMLLSPAELARELLLMTDAHTDALFAVPAARATTVAFPVSRLVVDPERFVDDAREPMAARGMGVVYTTTSHGRPLRTAPSAEERASLLRRFYEPHHEALTGAVSAALETHGSCLVLDGHSFPSRPLPYELDQRADRPEICVGTDAHHTPARLRDAAVAAFERAGFRVAVDRPFAGALVPMRFYGRDARVGAIMIEVNRATYMNEDTGERSGAFGAAATRICAALEAVLDAT